MNVSFIDLKSQYKEVKKEIDESVLDILTNGRFILGQEVGEFEQAFAKYTGTKYALGLASGRDALLLSLRSLGIGSGDEVIVPANTFIATVMPIIDLGAKPILVDVDSETYLIDPERIEKAVTKKTKAIIPVHLYGQPCDMKEINKIAKKHKLFVIEDACQAHGAEFNGKRCGSLGTIAAFSFYPAKNLGASGDGGAITTNSLKLYKKIKAMRDVGQTKKYHHDVYGYNSRLATIHAAFLLHNLKRLNVRNSKRIESAKLYNKLLSSIPVVTPKIWEKPNKSNFHLYVIRTPKRDKLIEFLKQNGVGTGIHYPIPVHLNKSTAFLGYKKGDFPITEKYAKDILSLPMHPYLTPEEVKYVCDKIGEFFER